jgi:hypothetical protein
MGSIKLAEWETYFDIQYFDWKCFGTINNSFDEIMKIKAERKLSIWCFLIQVRNVDEEMTLILQLRNWFINLLLQSSKYFFFFSFFFVRATHNMHLLQIRDQQLFSWKIIFPTNSKFIMKRVSRSLSITFN